MSGLGWEGLVYDLSEQKAQTLIHQVSQNQDSSVIGHGKKNCHVFEEKKYVDLNVLSHFKNL